MHVKEKKTSIIYHTDKQTALEAVESGDYTYSTKGAFKRYNNAVKQYMKQRASRINNDLFTSQNRIKDLQNINKVDSKLGIRRTGYFDFRKRRKAVFPVYSHTSHFDTTKFGDYNPKLIAYWKPK